MVEGASNGEQSEVLFRVILEEEIDDIALSVDHVCKRRSVSFEGPWTVGRDTYDQRDCQKRKNR